MVSSRLPDPEVQVRPPATMSWREFADRVVILHPALDLLSPAERVVAEYLCQGLTNKEIADQLGKSVPTVKNQVASCLAKLQVPSRARLVALVR